MSNRTLVALLLSVQLALAADHKASVRAANGVGASIESPLVGYFQSTAGLVAIEGIAGAAHARSLAPVEADRVVLPPGQSYAWLERAGQVYISRLPVGQLTKVPDAWSGTDLMAFNSSGSAAVLYRAVGTLQVIGGLPGAPHVVREIAAPSGANDITSIAVSDDTNTILVASSAGLYAVSGDDAWRFLMPGEAAALAFVPGRAEALIAVSDGVYLMKDSTTTPVLQGAGSPVAMLASDDGRHAVALSAGGTEALVLDFETGTMTRSTLGAAARDVQRGRDGTLIFVPQEGTSPWLMDMNSGVLSFAPELPGVAPTEVKP